MGIPGPEPPGRCPDLSPRHKLVQNGCPDLPEGSPDPGGEVQRILARNEQDEVIQAQVPGDHSPMGLSPSPGWMAGVQGKPGGGAPSL